MECIKDLPMSEWVNEWMNKLLMDGWIYNVLVS